MKSLKAIVTGSLFVIAVILLLQLAYIFIAVGYNSLAKDYPMLKEFSSVFRYVVGIPVVMAIMFSGGYITASLARSRVILHCAAVCVITVGSMMLLALQNADLTLTGGIVFVFALLATIAGGLYWQRAGQHV